MSKENLHFNDQGEQVVFCLFSTQDFLKEIDTPPYFHRIIKTLVETLSARVPTAFVPTTGWKHGTCFIYFFNVAC